MEKAGESPFAKKRCVIGGNRGEGAAPLSSKCQEWQQFSVMVCNVKRENIDISQGRERQSFAEDVGVLAEELVLLARQMSEGNKLPGPSRRELSPKICTARRSMEREAATCGAGCRSSYGKR